MDTPVVKAGEQIHDDSGELYATVARDCFWGETIRTSQFHFVGDVPSLGDPMPEFMVRWLEDREVVF